MCGHTSRIGPGLSGCYKCELNADELVTADIPDDDLVQFLKDIGRA